MGDKTSLPLPGFGFGGYRSFRGVSRFGSLTKITVLAGQNNSGKSNVLAFVENILGPLPRNPAKLPVLSEERNPYDIPRPAGDEPFVIELPIPDLLPAVPAPLHDFVARAHQLSCLRDSDSQLWIRLTLIPGQDQRQLVVDPVLVSSAIAEWTFWARDFRAVLTGLGGGTVDPEDVMSRLLWALVPHTTLPPIISVSRQRQVGKDVIDHLAELKNPDAQTWDQHTAALAAITKFVRRVLGDPAAELAVPRAADTINVTNGSRVLPLDRLGGGVEQVISLAVVATAHRNAIICIDEPETHLHPLLQKQLLTYLADHTENQYLLTTHSAHLLDDERVTVFHLRMADGSTANRARRPPELRRICEDLGYRPSDLLQSNAVIWVEGPSDRIYLRRWLELCDDSLVAELDYTIMFYGGKLLAHLSVDDDALTQFIKLRRLNRNCGIVIDSDLSSPDGRLNQTKERLREEFGRGRDDPGFAWVTECHTIENYVPRAILATAVAECHPNRTLHPGDEQWSNPLRPAPSARAIDKIAVAHAVVDRLTVADLDRWDLRQRIDEVCEFIRRANGRAATM